MRITMYAFLSFVLVWLVIAIWPRPLSHSGHNPFRSQDGLPHIIAHAGGNMEFPDNTLEAFYNAYHVDPNIIMEADINITQDGVVVLSHDRTFDRKTTLQYADVHETSYTDLVEQAIDFGYENPIDGPNGYNVTGERIPYTNYLGDTVTPLDVTYPEGVEPRHDTKFLVTTLEDLITAFPDNLIVIELKQHGDVGAALFDAVIDLMVQLDDAYDTFNRIVLASFHEDQYARFLEAKNTSHPTLMFSPQAISIERFYVLHLLRFDAFYRDPATAFHIPTQEGNINLATERFLRAAGRHNIAVHYWTINDEETMIELIELGADGILTDRPTLLKEILDRYRE